MLVGRYKGKFTSIQNENGVSVGGANETGDIVLTVSEDKERISVEAGLIVNKTCVLQSKSIFAEVCQLEHQLEQLNNKSCLCCVYKTKGQNGICYSSLIIQLTDASE